MAADIIASPPDFSAIGTTFTVFALAIAAIVAAFTKVSRRSRKTIPPVGKQPKQCLSIQPPFAT